MQYIAFPISERQRDYLSILSDALPDDLTFHIVVSTCKARPYVFIHNGMWIYVIQPIRKHEKDKDADYFCSRRGSYRVHDGEGILHDSASWPDVCVFTDGTKINIDQHYHLFKVIGEVIGYTIADDGMPDGYAYCHHEI